MSLRALAREVGVSPAYLSQVETGKEAVPAPPRLAQLESVLGLAQGELLALTDRVDPRALSLLRRQPAATDFLLAAAQAGFTDIDFRRLAGQLRQEADGIAPWWRRRDVMEPADGPLPVGEKGLRAVLAPERCAVQLEVPDRATLFSTLVETLADQDPGLDPPVVISLLHEREREASTAVGGGIAIPHAWLPLHGATTVTVATLRKGVVFDPASDKPVTLVFLVLSPAPPSPNHVQMLARIARLCHDPAVCESLRAAPSAEALYGRLCTFDRQAA